MRAQAIGASMPSTSEHRPNSNHSLCIRQQDSSPSHLVSSKMGDEDRVRERPSALFQSRPKMKSSVSFSGWSGLQSPGHVGLYSATTQGTYSRYGVGVNPSIGAMPSRPLRSSLQHKEQPSQIQQQYTQNYQSFRQRRHTMGTIYATTPLLRSPPVPSTPGRKSSIEKGGLWLASPTNEQSALALSPAVCASLLDYTKAIQDPQTGIQMQERIVVNQTKRVFSGADAIKWLVDKVEGIPSVEAAQLAGNHLLESGLIVGVSQPGQKKFVGSPNALYQFSVSPSSQEESNVRETQQSETEDSTQNENSSSDVENKRGKCLIQ